MFSQLKKFGLFGHRRTKSEPEFDGYVCPMEEADLPPGGADKHTNGGPTYSKPVKEVNFVIMLVTNYNLGLIQSQL